MKKNLQDEFYYCSQHCALIYEEMGLNATLTFLFAFLKRHYSLSRIFSGFRHYQKASFIPIADVLKSPLNTIMTLNTSSLNQEEINLLMGTDSFEPYLVQLPELQDSSQLVADKEDFTCYLRVPLFSQGEFTMQMAFCSRKRNTFQEKDKKILFNLTRPLSEKMKEKYNGKILEINQPHPKKTNRLFMCGGLHPLIAEVQAIAPTDCTVLIHGPTGAGKEIIVDTLHELSFRKNGPFIKVNCGAISESLLESELFGYEKGAFTGALQNHIGYFEAANGGTIFLDEIGELPLKMQVSLLRILDNREIMRVGGTKPIPVDVRIIAATHRNLAEMIQKNTFREDLWYRLNAYTLTVPPLAEHREDIPVLMRYYLNKFSREMHLSAPPQVSKEEMEVLFDYSWPGNIREFQNVMQRAVINAKTGGSQTDIVFSSIIHKLKQEQKKNLPPKENTAPPAAETLNRWVSLEDWNDGYIQKALDHCSGKITGINGAAHLLKIHPNTVRNYKKKKKLQFPQ